MGPIQLHCQQPRFSCPRVKSTTHSHSMWTTEPCVTAGHNTRLLFLSHKFLGPCCKMIDPIHPTETISSTVSSFLTNYCQKSYIYWELPVECGVLLCDSTFGLLCLKKFALKRLSFYPAPIKSVNGLLSNWLLKALYNTWQILPLTHTHSFLVGRSCHARCSYICICIFPNNTSTSGSLGILPVSGQLYLLSHSHP